MNSSPGPDSPSAKARWLLLVAGLVLLHLSHPQTWGRGGPVLWCAPVGIGVALAAWLGPVAALLVAADEVLVGLQAWMMGAAGASGWGLVARVLGEAGISALVAWAAWWAYRRASQGGGSLGDPHWATAFLATAPGLAAGLGALLRLALTGGLSLPANAAWQALAADWVGQALGILALTPVLLLTVTPRLIRWGLVGAELRRLNPESPLEQPPGWGDWIELSGLTLGTALLGLVLAVASGGGEVPAWHLWGLPLLFVVWASLRQGVRGGVIVSAAAAVWCLLAEPFYERAAALTPLQGNLLAQCITALLAGASVSWTRAKEARYRQVVGHIPVILYSARLHEGEGKIALSGVEITFVSPASRLVLGCPPEKLLGDYGSWLQRVHPEDLELLAAAVVQLRLDHKPVTCEYRLASGGRGPESGSGILASQIPDPCLLTPGRWVRDTLVPHIGPGGQVEGWEGVVEDITEQRALASDLRRTTGMFHALVGNLPAGVFFVHGSTGQPLLVNARARQLLGQREDSAAGLAQLSLVYRLYRPDGTPYPPDELPVSLALRQGVTSMRDDIVVHRPDGRRIPLVTWAAPIDLGGQGRPDAAVWVFEDLTALRQAEAARLESEAQLERAQRLDLVGRLASGIAHDFNNLLTVVLTLTDMARDHLPESHPVRHDLRRISEAGEQATRLASQLLAFGKQRPVLTRRLDLNPVTARTLDLIGSTLPCNIVVEADLCPGPLPVEADETRLQQVVMNLCLNARDAMAGGGRLTVQTSVLGPWVRLAVGDTGHGMDQSVQTRIFDPFFSTKERGTGLGLAVVQQIIESFGGRIEVWSQLGQGTRFDIWLPRAREGAGHEHLGH